MRTLEQIYAASSDFLIREHLTMENNTPKTLRDEYAMAALTALWANPTVVEKANEQSGGDSFKRRQIITSEAFAIADTAMTQRTK